MENNKNVDFIDYLQRQDDDSLILKSHLHLEQKIDELINKQFPNPKFIIESSFKDKISFLYSAGIIDDKLYNGLCIINKIRNNFSHKYQYSLSIDDLDLLRSIGFKQTIPVPNGLKESNLERTMFIVGTIGYLVGMISVLTKLAEKNPIYLHTLANVKNKKTNL